MPHREHTSKALMYGTRSQGISQFYQHTPRSYANRMNLFVISTGVINCLGRFVPEMTYYVSSGTLNLAQLKHKLGCHSPEWCHLEQSVRPPLALVMSLSVITFATISAATVSITQQQ